MNKRTLAVFAGGIFATALALAQPGPQGQPGPGSQPGPQGGRGWGNHGMMGGYGGGPGMMGPGMMGGFGWRNIPDLTADQRSKIDAIRRDLRNRQFTLMDQMHDQMHGTPFYRNGQFDEQAARRAYESTEKLRRQMFENALDAHKRMDALLTPAQRQQVARQYGGQQ